MDSQTISVSEPSVKPMSTADYPQNRAIVTAYPIIKPSFLKRSMDLILASIGLLLSAPLCAVIALAIKLEDGGPVLYPQPRWGLGGVPFQVLKFRTMVPHADTLYGNIQAVEDDGRVTRVGRLLRATGMDELPQLLCICKGQMSFVGPRALAVDEIIHDESGDVLRYEDIPGFYERLAVRPGLTSLATVYRPKDIQPKDKFRHDLLYIRDQSLWLDLRLVALSLWISLRGKWETRENKV
jgi:lipopolysaccharide/colanic/teichoic acid biosynthesis glycosyltransferase